MALSAALATALSGIRTAELRGNAVSNNIANASNEAYVRREVDVGTLVIAGVGQGGFAELSRFDIDEFLLRSIRDERSTLGSANIQAEATGRYADILGQPADERSLSSLTNELAISLQNAAADPDNLGLLQGVFNDADALAVQLEFLTDFVQAERRQADESIAQDVATVNDAVEEIERLNVEIAKGFALQRNVAAFQDERDRLLDLVSSKMDINVVREFGGTVSIFAAGGVPLLQDGFRGELQFTSNPGIDPTRVGTSLSTPPGSLSDLTIVNSEDPTRVIGIITPGSQASNIPFRNQALDGGEIFGHFQVRDETFVEFQNQLDVYAANLVALFQNSAVQANGDMEAVVLALENGVVVAGTPISGGDGILDLTDGAAPTVLPSPTARNFTLGAAADAQAVADELAAQGFRAGVDFFYDPTGVALPANQIEIDVVAGRLEVDNSISLQRNVNGNPAVQDIAGAAGGPPTPEPTQSGLFVVNFGGVFDPLDTEGANANFGPDAGALQLRGLAGSIAVNLPQIDPDAGGNFENIRNGVQADGAVAPFLDSQDATQLQLFADALTGGDVNGVLADLDYTIGGTLQIAPAAGQGFFARNLPVSGTMLELADSIVNVQQLERTTIQETQFEQQAFVDTLQEQRLNENGVNVDVELANLIEIEELFAANSRVIQTIARLLDELLAIR